MEIKKYLPVGSVVLLKGAQRKVVIIGYGVEAAENHQIYDYSACPYPEGVISSDKSLLFNHDQIEEVYYIGYNDSEWKELNSVIEDLITKAREEQKEK